MNEIKSNLSIIFDIVADLSKDVGALQGIQNRRADKRYPVSKPIQLGIRDRISGEFSSQLDAWTQDISLSGIHLLTETALDPDEKYDVDMKTFGAAGQFVRIHVVRCKQLLTNTFDIGASFQEG